MGSLFRIPSSTRSRVCNTRSQAWDAFVRINVCTRPIIVYSPLFLLKMDEVVAQIILFQRFDALHIVCCQQQFAGAKCLPGKDDEFVET